MAVLKILEFPDPRLRTKAKPVERFDEELKTLVANMFETMHSANGIGLAATQVNVHLQVVVMDIATEDSEPDPLVLVNPTWESLTDDTQDYSEGCLSVPGFNEDVSRCARIKVSALDVDGQPFSFECDGLKAVCIQHELDHLNGKLFVDYISSLKQQRIRQKIAKKAR